MRESAKSEWHSLQAIKEAQRPAWARPDRALQHWAGQTHACTSALRPSNRCLSLHAVYMWAVDRRHFPSCFIWSMVNRRLFFYGFMQLIGYFMDHIAIRQLRSEPIMIEQSKMNPSRSKTHLHDQMALVQVSHDRTVQNDS